MVIKRTDRFSFHATTYLRNRVLCLTSGRPFTVYSGIYLLSSRVHTVPDHPGKRAPIRFSSSPPHLPCTRLCYSVYIKRVTGSLRRRVPVTTSCLYKTVRLSIWPEIVSRDHVQKPRARRPRPTLFDSTAFGCSVYLSPSLSSFPLEVNVWSFLWPIKP